MQAHVHSLTRDAITKQLPSWIQHVDVKPSPAPPRKTEKWRVSFHCPSKTCQHYTKKDYVEQRCSGKMESAEMASILANRIEEKHAACMVHIPVVPENDAKGAGPNIRDLEEKVRPPTMLTLIHCCCSGGI